MTPNQIYNLWEQTNHELYLKLSSGEMDFKTYTQKCHENQIRFSEEIKKLIDNSE